MKSKRPRRHSTAPTATHAILSNNVIQTPIVTRSSEHVHQLLTWPHSCKAERDLSTAWDYTFSVCRKALSTLRYYLRGRRRWGSRGFTSAHTTAYRSQSGSNPQPPTLKTFLHILSQWGQLKKKDEGGKSGNTRQKRYNFCHMCLLCYDNLYSSFHTITAPSIGIFQKLPIFWLTTRPAHSISGPQCNGAPWSSTERCLGPSSTLREDPGTGDW